MLAFLSQVEIPYVFKVNGRLVQIRFTNNGKTAEGYLTNVLKVYIDKMVKICNYM